MGLLVGLAIAVPAGSHDLWVLPGKFVIAPGEKVRIFINTGDDFPASDALLSPRRIESLRLHTASGESSLSQFVAAGESLTAELIGPEPGTAILALSTRARAVRLRAEEFNQYLEEDGLPRILELRKRLGEMNQPAVERYAKWAKAILQVGDRQDETWSKALGLKLEIVPQTNPYTLRPGESLPVVVLFDGQPLADVEVAGGHAGTASRRVKSVTDSNGRATLMVGESGRWYLRTIHMIRLPDNADDPEAIWESYWSTLTFAVSP
ncbi:MAG: DUF4198 domain-containing protein [Vicinamibacteria bacterium]